MQAYSQLTNNRLGLSTLAGTNVDVPTAFPGGQTPVAGSVLPSHLGTEITTSVAMISKHQVPAALVTPTAMFPEVNPDPKYFVQVYGVRSRAMSNEQRKPLETALFAAAAPATSSTSSTPNSSR